MDLGTSEEEESKNEESQEEGSEEEGSISDSTSGEESELDPVTLDSEALAGARHRTPLSWKDPYFGIRTDSSDHSREASPAAARGGRQYASPPKFRGQRGDRSCLRPPTGSIGNYLQAIGVRGFGNDSDDGSLVSSAGSSFSDAETTAPNSGTGATFWSGTESPADGGDHTAGTGDCTGQLRSRNSLCNKTAIDLTSSPLLRDASVSHTTFPGQRDICSMFPAARVRPPSEIATMQFADEQVALLEQEEVTHLERIEVLRDRREKRVATTALPKEKGVSWSPDGPEERILFNETTATRKLVTKWRGSWFRWSQATAPNDAGESGDSPDSMTPSRGSGDR